MIFKFREKMLEDKHLKTIYDFENASVCFPGVHIDGGVCFFLWENSYQGETEHHFLTNSGFQSFFKHQLKNQYFDYVIRDSRIISILDKTSTDNKFSSIVSTTRPYGIRKYLFNEPERYPEAKLSDSAFNNSVEIYGVKGIKGGARRVAGFIAKTSITSNHDTINKYKLFFTTSYSTNAVIPPEPIIGKPGTVCTETFLLIGPFKNKLEMENCNSYMHSDFFRFLLYFGKGTMQVTKTVFDLIPLVPFNVEWTDEMLYKKYGLTEDEIAFIESMIRPMD